jgi:pentatricopeptide repeat-containing protein PET309
LYSSAAHATRPTPLGLVSGDDERRLAAVLEYRTAALDKKTPISKAWEAYEAVENAGAVEFLSVNELIQLAFELGRPVARTTFKVSTDEERVACLQQAQRLGQIMAHLGNRTNDGAAIPDLDYLTAYQLSLLGNISEARGMIRALLHRGELSPYAVSAFIHLVGAYRRAGHVAELLELIASEWGIFHHSFMQIKEGDYSHTLRMSTDVLRKDVFQIIEGIKSPQIWFLRRLDSWHGEQARIIGELMIACFSKTDNIYSAHAIYQILFRRRLDIPPELIHKVVRGLVHAGEFEYANAVFAELRKQQPDPPTPYFLRTSLLLFSHQGDVESAEGAYDALAQRRHAKSPDRTWLMHASAVKGHTAQVVRLFERFYSRGERSRSDKSGIKVRPTVADYNTIVYAFTNRGDIAGANHWIKEMIKAGFRPGPNAYHAVLSSFVATADVPSISTVLQQMHAAGIKPDRYTYSILMSLFAKRRDPVNAERMLKKALRENIRPDRHMILSLMNAHVMAGSWRGVIRIFDFLRTTKSSNLGLTTPAYNTLLKAYVMIGAPFSTVYKIFQQLEPLGVLPDAFTYSLVIQSACDTGRLDAASLLFTEMDRLDRKGPPGTFVNVFVMTIIMAGYLRVGDKVGAKAVYDDMVSRGIQPTTVTFSAILRAYGHEGTEESLRLAEEFLATLLAAKDGQRDWMKAHLSEDAPLQDLFIPLMVSHLYKLRPDEVEKHFRNMISLGTEPSMRALTPLLDAYRRVGDINAVKQVWEEIYKLALQKTSLDSLDIRDPDRPDEVVDLRATVENTQRTNILCLPLSIYVDALSSAGEHSEIARVWKQAKADGFGFDAHNWNHLVVALIRAGEPERAFEVLERVILPYRERTKHLRMERSLTPPTPFSYEPQMMGDEEEEDLWPTDDLAGEDLKHARQSNVATAAAKASEIPLLQSDTTDFALPLHVLHQISPPWKFWRPHQFTSQVLWTALTRLGRGKNVLPTPPISPPDAAAEYTANLDIDEEEQARLAYEIHDRIQRDYPRAVWFVNAWRARGRRMGRM